MDRDFERHLARIGRKIMEDQRLKELARSVLRDGRVSPLTDIARNLGETENEVAWAILDLDL